MTSVFTREVCGVVFVSMFIAFALCVDYRLVALLGALSGVTYFIVRSKIHIYYALLFALTVWVPIWINSSSVLGVRFGIVTINVPLIFVLGFIFKAVFQHRVRDINIQLIDVLLFMFALYCTLSYFLVSVSRASVSQWYQLIFPILIFFAGKIFNIEKKHILLWMRVLIYCSATASIYLVYEHFSQVNIFLPPIEIYNFMYDYSELKRGVYCSSGPFIDPNTAGLFLPLILAMCIYFVFSEKDKAKWIFCGLLIIAGIVSTFSRTSIVCVFAVASVICYFSNRLSLFSVLVVMLMVIGIVGVELLSFPVPFSRRLQDVMSIKARLAYYGDFFFVINNHWLFGLGFDNFRYRSLLTIGAPAHNIFYTILAELGIIGFVLYTAIITVVIKKIQAVLRCEHVDRKLVGLFVAIFLSYHMAGLTSNVMSYLQLNIVLYIWLGILFHPTAIFNNSALQKN